MNYITDYVSNPKSDKFNLPDYPYDVHYVLVRRKVNANQKNVTRGFMQCRTIEQAESIIEYWNRNDDTNTYIITNAWRRE